MQTVWLLTRWPAAFWQVDLEVTLEQLFQGCQLEAQVYRTVLSDPKNKPDLCTMCNGAGVTRHMRQIAPGMIQQVQGTCRRCGGIGIDASTVRQEAAMVKVPIETGMMDGSLVRCRSEGSIGMDGERGDVVVTIRQAEHSFYQRHRRHLIMNREVTLAEALLGVQFRVPTLDDGDLLLATEPPHVIRPGSLFMFPGGGMPVHQDPQTRGALIVTFQVAFPADGELTVDQLQGLRAAFEGGPALAPVAKHGTTTTAEATPQDLERVWRQEAAMLVPLDRSILQLPGTAKRKDRESYHGDGRGRQSSGAAAGFFSGLFGRRKASL